MVGQQLVGTPLGLGPRSQCPVPQPRAPQLRVGLGPPPVALLTPPRVGAGRPAPCGWRLVCAGPPSVGFAYRCPGLVQLKGGGGARSTGAGTMAAQKRVPLARCLLRAAAACPCQWGTLGSGLWGLQGALGLRLAPPGASSLPGLSPGRSPPGEGPRGPAPRARVRGAGALHLMGADRGATPRPRLRLA